MKKKLDVQNALTRLVKLYLPVDTVRRMDAAILRSGGAYIDRAEFVNEALIDRLAEEGRGVVAQEEPSLAHTRPPGVVDAPEYAPASAEDAAEIVSMFGNWLSKAPVPTLTEVAGSRSNFGLHNRDYPTIWACNLLARLTVEAGAPILWEIFAREMLQKGWGVGRRLAADDAATGRRLKLSIGFPTNMSKKEAAERRFLAHSFGLPTARGNPGPAFVFKWVGVAYSKGTVHIALTEAGITVLRALATAGHAEPPFSATAWRVFSDHLAANARHELKAWLSVLDLLRTQPNRNELVDQCAWWTGSEAGTNAMSYVSRGREWGLVELQLNRDNRYALTERGAEELDRLAPFTKQEGAQ